MKIEDKRQSFIERIKSEFPEKSVEILNGLEIERKKSFWMVNKKREKEIIQSLSQQGFELEKTDLESSYILKNDKQISKTQEFIDGDIYIQELSSIIPAILSNSNSKKILDLCAAPGSKSIYMSIHNPGSKITSNEKSFSRFKKLQQNAKKNNANLEIVNFDGRFLPKEYENSFDVVLVDVPCSNENELNINNLETFEYWNTKKGKNLSKLQYQLLTSSTKYLKKDGEIIYSTCTINPKENENIIEKFLNKHKQFELVDISRTAITNLETYKYNSNKEISKKSLRVMPNKYFGAFFVVRLKKTK